MESIRGPVASRSFTEFSFFFVFFKLRFTARLAAVGTNYETVERRLFFLSFFLGFRGVGIMNYSFLSLSPNERTASGFAVGPLGDDFCS